MPKYALFVGSCSPSVFHSVIEAKDHDEAIGLAWEAACEDYESYAGLHGIRDEEQIAEEEGLDTEEDAEEIQAIYEDERESWIDYEALELPDGIEETEEAVNEYKETLDKE